MYTETLIKEIADLKEQISEQKNAADKLSDEHCSQLASKDKTHAETKKSHERSLDELGKSHAAELKKLNADSKAEKERHAVELRQRMDEQTQRDERHQRELQSITSQHKEFLADLQDGHSKEILDKNKEMQRRNDEFRSETSRV